MSAQSGEKQLALFEASRERGDVGRSFSHLSLALYLLPHLKHSYYNTYLRIFEEWIGQVQETKSFSDVMTIFEVAQKHFPNCPDLSLLLARAFYRYKDLQVAWTYASKACNVCPRDPQAQDTVNRLSSALVDRWHIPMINDHTRNAAFKCAIEKAVRSGCDSVLDIGCGTGLLSIYARNAGAREVYGCEVDSFMTSIAKCVIESNLETSAITVFNKSSTDLTIPAHLPHRVQLVVSETVDAGLFGEHILTTLQHAWTTLLQPLPHPPQPPPAAPPSISALTIDPEVVDLPSAASNTKEGEVKSADHQNTIAAPNCGAVIPMKAEVFAALISCDYVAHQTKHTSDLPGLTGVRVAIGLEEPYMSEGLSRVPGGFTMLSEWTHVTAVAFNSPQDIEKHITGEVNKTFPIVCTASGTVDAIVLAFTLYLNEEDSLSTFPDSSTTCWENAVYPVTSLLQVEEGDSIPVDLDCHGVIKLSVQRDQQEPGPDLYLSEAAIRFLNSKTFTDAFLTVSKEARDYLKERVEGGEGPLVVCDTTPFPVAGLSLLTEWPNTLLYVEETSVQEALKQLGITVHLCEDLSEGSVDVLFLWPVTKEGTLQDGLMKKILLYRLVMGRGGLVFPQELDIVVEPIHCPTLLTMTRVDDARTSGIRLQHVLSMLQTDQQLDVALNGLPHTPLVVEPVPVLRVDLSSGHTSVLAHHIKEKEIKRKELLVLGGEPVQVMTHVTICKDSSITAVPYWFQLRFRSTNSSCSSSVDTTNDGTVLSTREPESPCNQSIFILEEPQLVKEGHKEVLEVVWRDTMFWVSMKTQQ